MDDQSLADDQSKATGLVQAGRQLAEARSAAGLSQEQLASQMHMGVEQLAALERGDQNELPEPVFIKAMVRRISSHLGLDADAMVQTLGPLTTKPPKRATPWATPRGIAPQNRRTFNPLPLVALAGLAGLGFVVWSNASELTRFAQGLRPTNQTLEPSEADLEVAEVVEELDALIVPAPPTGDLGLTISSSEPSWIALRREGVVEFEGLLNGERRIDNPDLVEIYAGRPDLVSTSQEGVSQAGTPLGTNKATGNDDLMFMWMGIGSQIDGLGHMGLDHVYYNGNRAQDFVQNTGLTKLSVDKLPPIVTRGVLLDITDHFGADMLEAGTAFNSKEIKAQARKQSVTIGKGDVVLFHTGWLNLVGVDNERFMAGQPGLGVDGAEYLASLDVVAIGSDGWALEVLPGEDPALAFPVHPILLAKHGIYILEVMDTRELAKDKVSEFLFVLGQPRFEGSVQAVINPVAIR